MEVVYIDELFALNFIIDYLITLCSARVCGVYLRRGRYALSALIGALYAVGTVLPGLSLLTRPAAKLACGAVMAAVAFAGEEALLKCVLAFFAVTAAFGGAVWASSLLTGSAPAGAITYFPMSLRTLLLSFAVCYAAVSAVFRAALKKSRRRIMTVAAALDGRSAVFRALRDTGNSLCDPVTGGDVLIASPTAAARLLPPECAPILRRSDPIDVLEGLGAVPGMRGRARLIPYSAVGVSSGLLPVFRPDKLMVDGRELAGALIAVSPTLEGGGEYEAVL